MLEGCGSGSVCCLQGCVLRYVAGDTQAVWMWSIENVSALAEVLDEHDTLQARTYGWKGRGRGRGMSGMSRTVKHEGLRYFAAFGECTVSQSTLLSSTELPRINDPYGWVQHNDRITCICVLLSGWAVCVCALCWCHQICVCVGTCLHRCTSDGPASKWSSQRVVGSLHVNIDGLAPGKGVTSTA